MNTYYIKYITGPGGQQGYPENRGNLIAFKIGEEKACDRFKKCDGFLIYETGHSTRGKIGAKAIYARGVIAEDQTSFLHLPGFGVGEEWPYVTKVVLEKRVNPIDGVPLKRIEEIIEKRLAVKHGGIWKITDDQFDKLSSELESC